MDIGDPERTYTVEPIEDPVPQRLPEKADEPVDPEPAPSEQEKVSGGA